MPSAPTPGTLHIVSTPIGNLEDVTYRAVRVLGEVDLIAAEDTRRAARLLARYGIRTPRTSFHEHNEARKTPALLARLARGERLALVSDAGTPLVSDPGRRLARAAIEAGVRVEAVPGPSAVLAALVTCGLGDGSFTFAGFPPNRAKARKQWYSDLAGEPRPLVLFEAPHRIRASLGDLREVAGDRTVAVCRELTKMHEECVTGTVSEVLEGLQAPRGEFTLVVLPGERPPAAAEPPDESKLAAEFGQLTAGGLSRRASIRALATRYALPSRVVYQVVEAERAPNEGD